MSLSRKALTAMGIDEEKVDQIIEMHTATVNGLKDERDSFKADAEKLVIAQKELDELKEAAKSGDRSPYKVKYEALLEEKEALQKEFDDFKADQEAKATKAEKQEAYKALLKEIGVSEKRIDSILKISDIDSLELEDGKLKNADDLKKSAKEEWADFIVTEGSEGAKVENPPANNGTDQKTVSYAARRAAEYHANLYGGIKEE